MKQQKRLYNDLLRRYNKYRNRLQNLQQAGKNHRRQGILQKHISRLHARLSALWVSIQKPVAITSVAVSTMAFQAQETQAQTFGAAQTNPFSLNDLVYGSSPTLVDIDGDGDNDLFSGEHSGNFFYFENTGTANAPVFGTAQINSFSLTDIGFYSSPAFADLDGDGDFDMLSGGSDGNFFHFENTGTVNAPVFGAAQTNAFSLTGVGSNSSPTFVDLDGDGDFDLLTGESDGNFFYFENTGTVNAPVFGAAQTNPFSLTDVGDRSNPAFVDLDGDGDFDMMSGALDGNFLYFENTGTVNAPVFGATQTNPFSLTNVGFFSSPAFADLDGDCDVEILAGEYYGNFIYFENTTVKPPPTVTNTSPTLMADASGATYQWLDCDNNFAVVSGETNQSFTATANGNYAVEVTISGCTDTSACEAVTNVGDVERALAGRLAVYPNPTTGQLNIDFGGAITAAIITITNAIGQVVSSQKITATNRTPININGDKGLYVIEVATESGYSERIKVVKR